MSYSNDFKINVNRLNAEEMLLVLLEIEHPFITDPVRIVNDNTDFLSNSNNFTAMPFEVKRQNDVQGELPKIKLTISNIGRSFIKWIDSSGGGRGSSIKVMLARRSTPNIIEETLNLGIDSITVTTETIVFNLVIQNNFIKRSVKWIFDTNRNPGLF